MSRRLVRHERKGGWERAGRGVKKEETEGSRAQGEYRRHKESFFILAGWFSTQPAEVRNEARRNHVHEFLTLRLGHCSPPNGRGTSRCPLAPALIKHSHISEGEKRECAHSVSSLKTGAEQSGAERSSWSSHTHRRFFLFV